MNKHILLILFSIILFSAIVIALPTTYNPYTGKLDFYGIDNKTAWSVDNLTVNILIANNRIGIGTSQPISTLTMPMEKTTHMGFLESQLIHSGVYQNWLYQTEVLSNVVWIKRYNSTTVSDNTAQQPNYNAIAGDNITINPLNTNYSLIYQNATASNLGNWTFSIFAKSSKDYNQTISIGINTTNGESNEVNYSIDSRWQRIAVTMNFSSNGMNRTVYVKCYNNCSLWGAQLEPYDQPHSYNLPRTTTLLTTDTKATLITGTSVTISGEATVSGALFVTGEIGGSGALGTSASGYKTITSPIGYYNPSTTDIRFYLINTSATGLTGNRSSAGLWVEPKITTANNGVHPVITSALFNPVTFTAGAIGNNVNYTSTVYIRNASYGGRLGNYSIMVMDGNVLFKNGNIGIGIENPTNKLDVSGTINSSQMRLNDLYKLYFGSANDFSITHNGTANVFSNEVGSAPYIFSGGNVGIGRHNATFKLDVGNSDGSDGALVNFVGGNGATDILTIERVDYAGKYAIYIPLGQFTIRSVTSNRDLFSLIYSDAGYGLMNQILMGRDGGANIINGSNGIIRSMNAGTTGTDTFGGSLYIASGKGNGAGPLSNISFLTPDLRASGSTQQTYSTKMIILGNGNVGINSSNPLSVLDIVKPVGNSPYASMQVLSGTAGYSSSIAMGRTTAEAWVGVAGGTDAWVGGTSAGNLALIGTKIHFGTLAGAAPPTMTVDTTNKRVGIGKTIPNYELDVNGTINATQMRLNDLYKMYFGTANDFSITHNGTANVFSNEVGSAPYIFSGGNVGIGTTTPWYPLHVESNTSVANGSISIWASNNISAAGFITRTSVWDESKGSALSQIKSASELTYPNGTINHKSFGDAFVSYPKQVKNGTINIQKYIENCTDIIDEKTGEAQVYCKPYTENTEEDTFNIIQEEGVSLDMMIAKHEQALFELREENKMLKSELCMKDNTYSWCK